MSVQVVMEAAYITVTTFRGHTNALVLMDTNYWMIRRHVLVRKSITIWDTQYSLDFFLCSD